MHAAKFLFKRKFRNFAWEAAKFSFNMQNFLKTSMQYAFFKKLMRNVDKISTMLLFIHEFSTKSQTSEDPIDPTLTKLLIR